MKKASILLADDHQIVLDGLCSLLEPEFHLLGTATNGRELIEQARALDPDVIVADISMPLLNGIEAVRKLREEGVRARVVFLTMHPDATYVSRALEAGASGYVLKHSASDELVVAIREALAGRTYLSPALRTPSMEELLDETRRHGKRTIELTSRQREVLQLLAEGKSAKEIGAILNISPRTVETHKYKLMDDLGVKTSAELVQHAIRHGLIALGTEREES
ncbi:MAG: response regulator transcription factor [Bryobacteraceae bacterium]|nr:response regulator transcription factor [Bryobacteraceae bacterium]MDW8379940.1 response regulator transcription factor [Bryobacterales bacterium]